MPEIPSFKACPKRKPNGLQYPKKLPTSKTHNLVTQFWLGHTERVLTCHPERSEGSLTSRIDHTGLISVAFASIARSLPSVRDDNQFDDWNLGFPRLAALTAGM
jgi:hypothetical protein